MTTLRDAMGDYVPSWLADSYPASASYGYRLLYVIGRFVDAGISAVMQGALSAAGRGSPSALKYVAQERGITRGRFDTDDTFAAKLPTWIDRWKEAGSQLRLATEIWEYLGDARVRVVNRAGHWVTIDTDGTITTADATWDWDSVSNPERNDPDNPWRSDEWVIVCPSWAFRTGTRGGLTGDDGFSIGHLATPQEVDAVKGLCLRWKAAHSCVRAIIWTNDTALFDPTDSSTRPNGTWGMWGIYSGGHYVLGGRDLVHCRFWEPR